ncbi:MAG TPA: hypothetical protein VM681_05495 [Candidatus Thermoplasmatota archaeon]|nr:hypothetical protein [Candidatus Thermoplasmatota archaeon]
MVGKTDLTPKAAFVGIKTVDSQGRIGGLEPHAGKDFLLIKIPPLDASSLEELPRALAELQDEFEARYAEARKEAEEKVLEWLRTQPQLAGTDADKYAKSAFRVADKAAQWAVDRSPVGLAKKIWPEIEEIATDILAKAGRKADEAVTAATGGAKAPAKEGGPSGRGEHAPGGATSGAHRPPR